MLLSPTQLFFFADFANTETCKSWWIHKPREFRSINCLFIDLSLRLIIYQNKINFFTVARATPISAELCVKHLIELIIY